MAGPPTHAINHLIKGVPTSGLWGRAERLYHSESEVSRYPFPLITSPVLRHCGRGKPTWPAAIELGILASYARAVRYLHLTGRKGFGGRHRRSGRTNHAFRRRTDDRGDVAGTVTDPTSTGAAQAASGRMYWMIPASELQ